MFGLLNYGYDSSLPTNPMIINSKSIRCLHDDTFYKARGLTDIRIQLNLIDSVQEYTFRGLTNLQSLSLWGNSIVTLPLKVFDGLTTLKYIDLSDNKISVVDDIFSGLSLLTTLRLISNSISDIALGRIAYMTGVLTIHLDYNPITTLKAEATFEAEHNTMSLSTVDAIWGNFFNIFW
jgi:Leucine-rich repeat (LRR) protein